MAGEDGRNLLSMPGPQGHKRREEQLGVDVDDVKLAPVLPNVTDQTRHDWVPERVPETREPDDFEIFVA
jgi:hypothetical protein